MNLQAVRSWIASGKKEEALQWLINQPETPDVLLLKAVCIDVEKAMHWQRAIAALSQLPASDLLHTGQGISQARRSRHITSRDLLIASHHSRHGH